ncbi:MAG: hypothetical protein ACX94B_16860 [Henriciella sp.]
MLISKLVDSSEPKPTILPRLTQRFRTCRALVHFAIGSAQLADLAPSTAGKQGKLNDKNSPKSVSCLLMVGGKR